MKTRQEIRSLLLCVTQCLLLCSFWGWPTLATAEWYKGNLHAHSYWSDGQVFPEQAVAWYKDRGYNFLALTDHRQVQHDREMWVSVLKSREKHLAEYVQRFGSENVELREIDGKKEVRLKTFAEMASLMNEDAKFLLIPGLEIDTTIGDKWVHMNIINMPETLFSCKAQTVAETIALNSANVQAKLAEMGQRAFLMLNHPSSRYFDNLPEDIIDIPDLRFFELTNGGLAYPSPEKTWRHEKFWDVVNAHRIESGFPPIYGVGTDDRHSYENPKSAFGWSWVNAETLTPESIVTAMYQGNFYASTGVELEKVDFDPATKQLTVKIKPENNKKYRIEFIGTKKGFDRSTQPVDILAGSMHKNQGARKINMYSDEIGRIFQTVEAFEASYQLQDDDLYVRARITEIKDEVPSPELPAFLGAIDRSLSQAWTQPYRSRVPMKP